MKIFLVAVLSMWTLVATATVLPVTMFTGKLTALNKDDVVLENADGKISVPRKLMKEKHAVGERITIEVPDAELSKVQRTKSK